MPYKFYIKMDEQIYGPYSLQEYHDLNVPDDTEVLEESVGQWCQASDYPTYEELRAREMGYLISHDGEVERVRDESQLADTEEIPAEEVIEEPYIPQHQFSDKAKYQDSYSNNTYSSPNTGWNWGAFIFNWLWAIFNGIYWPLIIIPVSFIPYIGGFVSLTLCVVLDFKGNIWAWNAKTWDNAEHFNNVQHRWSVAAGIYVLVLVGVFLLASFL